METVNIPKEEYLLMKKKIKKLENMISILDDDNFLEKLNFTYNFFFYNQNNKQSVISIKRGSAKNIITDIADDFDAPLEDFNEYM